MMREIKKCYKRLTKDVNICRKYDIMLFGFSTDIITRIENHPNNIMKVFCLGHSRIGLIHPYDYFINTENAIGNNLSFRRIK